ncbi:MAG: F0F1 ATP synthase subunit B [Candidatus Electrothrix sp. YB6]
MKLHKMKRIVPALLVVGLCGGIFGTAFAAGHGGYEEAEHPAAAEHAVQAVEQEQQGHQQVVNPAAGEPDAGHIGHSAVAAQGTDHNAEHAAAGHGEEHGGHNAPMLTAEKLKDLFWRAINFIALVFLLVKFLGKPVTASLGGRRREIQEELDAMEEQRDAAERSYKEFTGRLAGMQQEAEEIVAKARAMAEDEKARILAEAEAAAKDIRRQAEAAVQGAFADVKTRLQAEVAEQAVAMAEELIVRNMTPEDQVAITEQFLERVSAVQ